MKIMPDKEIDEIERLRPKTVDEIIQREGEKELERPVSALWWSGFVAGIAISASVVAQSVLHEALPNGDWQKPIASLGYCVGFIIVILSRLQLFTEGTITPVLPIMAKFSGDALLKILRYARKSNDKPPAFSSAFKSTH
jgi:formate/nitrite transporter FocA (FNT family)